MNCKRVSDANASIYPKWMPAYLIIQSPAMDLLGGLSGRRSDLMVSALVPGASGPGSSPGRGHCVVFLGKTLNSHSAFLTPGVSMGTGKLLGKPNNLSGSDLWWTSIPSSGSRNIPSHFMLQKPGISSGAMGQSALRLHCDGLMSHLERSRIAPFWMGRLHGLIGSICRVYL